MSDDGKMTGLMLSMEDDKKQGDIRAVIVITMLKDGTTLLTIPDAYPKDAFFVYGMLSAMMKQVELAIKIPKVGIG